MSRGKETKYWHFKYIDISSFAPELWNSKDIKYAICNKELMQGVVIFHSRKRLPAVLKSISNAQCEALDFSNVNEMINKYKKGKRIELGQYMKKSPIAEFKTSVNTLLVSGALSLGEFVRCSPVCKTHPDFAEEFIIKNTTFTAEDFDRLND